MDEAAKTITLVDVTMPFENGSSAFQSARSEKTRKYGPLADHFRQQGYDVFSDAFVVGATIQGTAGAAFPGVIACTPHRLP